MSHEWTFAPFDPDDGEARAIWLELAMANGGSPVLMPDFVFSCARTIGPGALWTACCRRDGIVVATALLQRHGRPNPEVFVEPQMPLGAWVQWPTEDFIELARSLFGESMTALRIGAAQFDPRFVARPQEGDLVHTLDYIETAWVEFEGTFDDYWRARGKNLRTNMRRQRDKLAAQGVQTRMEILTSPSDMERGVADYAGLESMGWKAQLGTAVSETHPQTVFYRQMLTIFAEKGQARVYRYFFDDRLVATEFCLVGGGEMVILKTTHDESVKPFSPASLLRQEMFSGLMDEGVIRRVEFYGPLKEWHTRWTNLSRTIYHANLYRFRQVRHIESLVRRGLGKTPKGEETAQGAQVPARGGDSDAVESKAGAGAGSASHGWTAVPAGEFVANGAEQWARLNREHCADHPVFDARFVFAVLDHFPGSDIQAMVLGDRDAPRGVVLLERVGPGVWRNFQRSQMQVSPILLAPEDFPKLHDLFAVLPAGTLAVEFLNQDRAFVRWPSEMLADPVVELLDAGKTGTISLDGSFDEYWEARSRKLQHDIVGYVRRLSLDGRPLDLRVVEDTAGIVESVRQFGLMESRGWKARGGTAVHPENAQGRFYGDVFERFSRSGQAIAYELHAGSDVIARQLALASGPVMLTLKTTYDEGFRHVAPGRLLDYEMLRTEFRRRRFKSVELCTRADDMQLRWASTDREIVHISMFRSATAKRVFHSVRGVARRFRAWGPDRMGADMSNRASGNA